MTDSCRRTIARPHSSPFHFCTMCGRCSVFLYILIISSQHRISTPLTYAMSGSHLTPSHPAPKHTNHRLSTHRPSDGHQAVAIGSPRQPFQNARSIIHRYLNHWVLAMIPTGHTAQIQCTHVGVGVLRCGTPQYSLLCCAGVYVSIESVGQ